MVDCRPHCGARQFSAVDVLCSKFLKRKLPIYPQRAAIIEKQQLHGYTKLRRSAALPK